MTSNDFISSAKTFLGKKYVWGGESDAEGGYDCSGFVYAALKKAGYNTTRKTAQGYSTIGSAVSLNAIKAGDLLFFGKSQSKVTHIAIYIGSGQMIESRGGSTNTKENPGIGVVISSYTRRSDLVKARRVCGTATTNSDLGYTVGKTYTTGVGGLTVRVGPATNFAKVGYSALSENAKANANKSGTLKKGTKVTCKGATTDSYGNVWMKIPSGWIAAKYEGKTWVI